MSTCVKTKWARMGPPSTLPGPVPFLCSGVLSHCWSNLSDAASCVFFFLINLNKLSAAVCSRAFIVEKKLDNIVADCRKLVQYY